MKQINVYEIPVLDILEAVLTAKGLLGEDLIQEIVLDFERAIAAAHTLRKEQAHDTHE